jgi:epoxyqueuosine reductase
MNESAAAVIKSQALAIGFSHVGICRVEPGEQVTRLAEWLQANYHGRMAYMENPKRLDPQSVVLNVRTIVVVGLNYRWPEGRDRPQDGMISKYAWADDYHRVMTPMLAKLSEHVLAFSPGSTIRTSVDTGPVVEKYWAQKAGIGWIGKHTNIISRHGSSWLFLGAILTDLPLESDPPAQDHCGTCSRCIEACPTGAIIAPYVLDARLCISYLTIELRDSIPRQLRALIGNRIFGCDDCQDVCPWNRFAYAGDPRFAPRADVFETTLADYLQMTPETFRARFAGTNILRARYSGFMRNCLVAAGNSRSQHLVRFVTPHLESTDDMIREHALWAYCRLQGSNAIPYMEVLEQNETSPKVLAEIDFWRKEWSGNPHDIKPTGLIS